jgi:hypothetical protein
VEIQAAVDRYDENQQRHVAELAQRFPARATSGV